jgi:hypothetical protein
MSEYPMGDPNAPLQPGTWKKWGQQVLFCCPLCKNAGLLDHQIAADGTVTPSVQCATHGCTFHENGVKLRGWTP